MSERLKKELGNDELYNKIVEGLKAKGYKAKDIDIIKDNYVTKSRFDEINSENKNNKEKIGIYEKERKDTKELLKENEDLKGKYDSLNSTHTKEIELRDKANSNLKKEGLIREQLILSGAKRPNLLLKEFDLEKIQIDGEKLIGYSDAEKSLKKSYPELFIEKQNSSKPPKDTNKGGNDDGETGGTGDNDTSNIFSRLLEGQQF